MTITGSDTEKLGYEGFNMSIALNREVFNTFDQSYPHPFLVSHQKDSKKAGEYPGRETNHRINITTRNLTNSNLTQTGLI